MQQNLCNDFLRGYIELPEENSLSLSSLRKSMNIGSETGLVDELDFCQHHAVHVTRSRSIVLLSCWFQRNDGLSVDLNIGYCMQYNSLILHS